MQELKILLDDDTYKALEVQKRTVELVTEVNRSMKDFVTMLIVIGSFSLGTAMTPQNIGEMNGTILSLAGEAPAEEVPLINRLYALMRTQRSIGLQR